MIDQIKKRFKQVIKGSAKTPCSSIRVLSIGLFLIIISLACFQDKALNQKEGAFLAQVSGALQSAEESLFLSPNTKNWGGSPEFLLVENSSLKGSAPPTTFSPQVLGALVTGNTTDDSRKAIIEYIVEDGDSLSLIASKFNISLDTLLWANSLTKSTAIQPGQKLIILPVSGVIHHIKNGDTISQIAQNYKADADEILSFNNISNEGDIFIGDIVIIPGGTMPAPKAVSVSQAVPLADSYFICPIAAPCRITQGLHWYNAIDFSHGKCGEAIYAAAAGTVLKVKLTSSTSKWAYDGAGNHISILHPNGVVTTYGHLSASLVEQGDTVSQGQMIALMGGEPGTPGAGFSTGCHLHFGVSGARNPFAY